MPSIALVDCNNFFVSCERVFNPKLHKKAVVVLSNNDGCIVSRSQEAKDLGIPMGGPYFQWADFMQRHAVTCLSANFALYSDLSHRVMQTLIHFNPDLEIYSIDEAFLQLNDIKDVKEHCFRIREKVMQWVGIPVSIGIASTKTLAKVANSRAKKRSALKGVCMPTWEEMQEILKVLPVQEVWGIGRRLAKMLSSYGIHTAAQLCAKDDTWIQKQMTVTGLRLVWELRGRPCHVVEEVNEPRQSIMTSRSFATAVFEKEQMQGIIAHFTARCSEKLRADGTVANWIQIFIMTSPHQEGGYSNYAQLNFPESTDDTPTLLDFAGKALDAIFRPGYPYKRAGVIVGDCVEKGARQLDLFMPHHALREEKKEALMQLMDKTNETFGYPILRLAAEQKVHTKKQKRSPCFTTNWDSILTIK